MENPTPDPVILEPADIVGAYTFEGDEAVRLWSIRPDRPITPQELALSAKAWANATLARHPKELWIAKDAMSGGPASKAFAVIIFRPIEDVNALADEIEAYARELRATYRPT